MTAPDIREVPALDPDPLDGTVESMTINVPPGSTMNIPDWTWQRGTAPSREDVEDARSIEEALARLGDRPLDSYTTLDDFMADLDREDRHRLVIVAAASFVTGLLLGAAVARL